MRRKKKPRVFTYSGLRPYYRRRLRTGEIVVYLGDSRGKAGKLIIGDPQKAALFERGKTHTVEHTEF